MGCNRKFYGSLEYQDCQKRKINTIKNTKYIGVKIVLGKMKEIQNQGEQNESLTPD